MRLKVAALVLALVLGLAVPTAAVTGSQDDAGPITMAPHSGPNGQYASVSGGEIEVAFTQLNDEAVTTADRVFTITADANESVEVWIEVENVTAYRGDDPGTEIDSADQTVVLDPGETVDVGFQLDTRGSVPDPNEMTVHAREPSTGSGGDAGGGSEPLEPDIEATLTVANGSDPYERIITVTVFNNGTATGSYVAEPTVEGDVIAVDTVTVAPDEVRELTYVYRFPGPGDYQVGLDDQRVTVTIPGATGPAPEFRVRSLEPANESVPAGTNTELVATVENVGDVAGTYTAVLTDDGTVVAEREVTIPAGERRQVVFAHAFERVGVHELVVGERRATITVTQASGVRVVDAFVADDNLEPGNSTTITATVENAGDTVQTVTLDVTVADVVVETLTVSVPAGQTRTVSVERRFARPGVYPVAVGGVSAGDVVVGASDTAVNRLLTSSTGVTVGIPLLVGLLLAIWRRQVVWAIWHRV